MKFRIMKNLEFGYDEKICLVLGFANTAYSDCYRPNIFEDVLFENDNCSNLESSKISIAFTAADETNNDEYRIDKC
jgi:hypothetical protein